jgi:hypothetical protein
LLAKLVEINHSKREILVAFSTSKIQLSSALSPDQLKRLAEIEVAQAGRIESGGERLRRLAIAEALTNLAEIKRLLLEYERRFLD